jgi:hypothetical protein
MLHTLYKPWENQGWIKLKKINQAKSCGWIIRKEKRYNLIIRRKKDVGEKIIDLKKMGPKCK